MHYVLIKFVNSICAMRYMHTSISWNSLISWKCEKKDRSPNFLLKPNIELPLTCIKIIWLRDLFFELDFPQAQPTSLRVDNTGATPIYHEHSNHIEVDCHSIIESFDLKEITQCNCYIS